MDRLLESVHAIGARAVVEAGTGTCRDDLLGKGTGVSERSECCGIRDGCGPLRPTARVASTLRMVDRQPGADLERETPLMRPIFARGQCCSGLRCGQCWFSEFDSPPSPQLDLVGIWRTRESMARAPGPVQTP